MKKRTKPLITEMTESDALEIATWEIKFSKDKDFEPIKKYLDFVTHQYTEDLEFMQGQPVNGVKTLTLTDIIDGYHFSEVKKDSYDPFEEQFLAYVMRNFKNEIVLFALINFRDLPSHHNPAQINSLVVHPKYQNKGYATKFLNELFENQSTYFGWSPDKFEAEFSPDNESAKKLFKKFGFDIIESKDYTAVQTYSPQLISQTQPGSNE